MLSESRDGEAGFTLLEVTIAAGLIAFVTLATLGALASVLRHAEPGRTRDLARATAENTLARARAALAYVPLDPVTHEPVADASSWGLAPGTNAFRAAGRLRGALCGTRARLDVPLAVTTAFDPATRAFAVTVTYPRDPCANAGELDTLAVRAVLSPPRYLPGTALVQQIPDPTFQ